MNQTGPGIRRYPAQFWLMFSGMLISTMSASTIWPFLLIYVSAWLGLARAVSASLLTFNSVTILIASLLGGSVIDRFGRKWVMVVGLFLNGVLYFSTPGLRGIDLDPDARTCQGIVRRL